MMWRFTHLPESTRTDAENFLSILNKREDFFSSQQPVVVARAPGRLDLMGGIADYSGALVLELPLAAATWAAVQFNDESAITLQSTGVKDTPEIKIPLAELARLDYEAAHTLLTREPERSWAAYVVGCLIVLQRECGLRLERGLNLFLHSNIPIGKGVSSSAALEVATMQALSTLYDLHIAGRELALLCQKVENLIVGAPCGIMDQMTSACGKQESLLALLCQPAELQESITFPNELEIWGIDSGIRHAVSGADYTSVRIGAFMGYRIIADLAGLPVQPNGEQSVSIEDRRWQGYLANISPSLWESVYRDHLPQQINGEDFLRRYHGSTDSVTRIDPAHMYAVRQPTAHPIYEHYRVCLFRALLARLVLTNEDCCLLGELMYQSHASYSACGLGSNGTDSLVELVRQAGPTANCYGAKITGGGSGGTVAVLARRGSQAQIAHIANQYAQETGYAVEILGGSSPGAVTWGSHNLVAV